MLVPFFYLENSNRSLINYIVCVCKVAPVREPKRHGIDWMTFYSLENGSIKPTKFVLFAWYQMLRFPAKQCNAVLSGPLCRNLYFLRKIAGLNRFTPLLVFPCRVDNPFAKFVQIHDVMSEEVWIAKLLSKRKNAIVTDTSRGDAWRRYLEQFLLRRRTLYHIPCI